ncbi:MAG TPA: DUF1573 domain-containing protein [Gemmataceae bacterium]|nr:DUF1573 domain-containing protein [Gemmataceae bacterium]
MLRYSFAFVAGLMVAAPAMAGSWGEGLFDEYSKDFGSVPHGQVLTHPFTVKNNTGKTVTISGVRVSCNLCTSATALKGQLQPGEETSVSVRMDSGKFYGVKTVYVYVTFSEPQYDEVRLWIQANSREDINVTPESLGFGRVRHGEASSKTVSVTFYGGVPSEITGVTSESNYVQAKVGAARKGGNEVTYELIAKLRPDTPVGKWYTDVWVTTNNPSLPKVRVPLTVEIDPAVTVNTTTVALGDVKVGETAERKLVVRGDRPFKITAIKGDGDGLEVKDNSAEAREQHVLTVRLKGGKPGEFNRKVQVLTDIKDEGEVEFRAKGQIVP